MKDKDGCDYYIIIQQQEPLHGNHTRFLKSLPRNARVLYHSNECFDLGTVGWLLSQSWLHIASYKHVVLINSSVRGPFVPIYLRDKVHWTRIFTEKLNDDVKLVGSTISCGISHNYPPTPHVQTYAVATDDVGIQILLSSSNALRCHKSMNDAVTDGEIGASAAILKAGYNIDSLMLRYQKVDWRLLHNSSTTELQCNAVLNPLQPYFYDGTDIDPMEVMFVKVKDSFLKAGWNSAVRAAHISSWIYEESLPHSDRLIAISSNAWLDSKMQGEIDKATMLGHKCFDWKFYVESNLHDLAYILEEEDPARTAWEQFLEMGIFEGRPHQWTPECRD